MDFYTTESFAFDNFYNPELNQCWPVFNEEALNTPRVIEPSRKPSFDEIV